MRREPPGRTRSWRRSARPDANVPIEPVCQEHREQSDEAGGDKQLMTARNSADGAVGVLDPPPPLVETKFAQPRQRSGIVERKRILHALDAADGAELTLLAAPTGYGKTTAVRAWCARGQAPVAWVTLDAGDNDPVRLWTYVASAVDRIRQGLGRPALLRLRATGVSLEVVVDELVNGIVSYSAPLIVVLDDLQAVTDLDCLASIEYAVERLPANARLLVISRVDPTMHLARMRGRGTLVELRAAELAFSREEARELLVEREGISLVSEDVEALVERTEGWPAGLYLAALWLRGLDDPSSRVREFAGHHRQVADYLGSEVLDALAGDVRSFLMRSAVLGRFTAELSDEVLGRTDSSSMLAALEQSNLFLVPLDGAGAWFRYHTLFSERLRLELVAIEPEAEVEIHRRASVWFRERGFVIEAAEHAAEARDFALVAQLLADNHLIMLRSGLSSTLLRWIRTLPEPHLLEFPILPVAAAVALGLTAGPAVERRRFLALADRAKAEYPERLVAYHDAAVEMARSTWIDDDVGEAISHGRQAVALSRAGASDISVATLASLATALYMAGDLDGAAEAAQNAVRDVEAERQTLGRIEALSTLVLVTAERGHLAAARFHADELRTIVREAGLRQGWVGGSAAAAQAVVLAAEGRLSDAEPEAAHAEQTRRGPEANVSHAWTLILLASIRARRGHLSQAESALDEASQMLVEFPDAGRVPAMADEARTVLEQAKADADVLALREPPTPAELEILRLLATNLSQREIGKELFLSLNTVKTHTRNIYRKLGATSRQDAIARAVAAGRLDPSELPEPPD
jgi:LuxR family maltose regulon positive regulatory protein